FRPVNCSDYSRFARETKLEKWDRLCTGSSGRPSPNTESARGHTMSALANLYYNQKKMRATAAKGSLPRIPFWIANASAGVNRHPWRFGFDELPDIEDSIFEFTPYAFGSRHFGRWVGTPTNVELAKIAGASAAFLDAQQRVFQPLKNLVLAGLMHAF